MEKERKIKEGYYQYTDGAIFYVIGIARQFDTGEKFVVYQNVPANGKLFVRSYEDFAAKINTNDYPDAKQEYYFEKVPCPEYLFEIGDDEDDFEDYDDYDEEEEVCMSKKKKALIIGGCIAGCAALLALGIKKFVDASDEEIYY